MTTRDTLLARLRRDAYQFREEPFTLKSGKTSQHYIDCRRVLLSPMALDAAAVLIARLSFIMSPVVPDAIAGVVVGASALAIKVAEKYGVEAVWVRPEAKGHGTKKLVETSAELDRMMKTATGVEVVLVEDVTTSGGSAIDAAKALTEAGLTVAGVVTLVDREDGAAARFQELGIPFASVFKLSEVQTDPKESAR
jgi:orotate phosphoribosyltransferase